MTEKEYRKLDAINYSTLSRLNSSPVGLNAPSEQTSFFTMGSLVDCLCTTPNEYYDKYYVSTVAMPSDAMVEYCKALVETNDPQAAWTASGLKSDPAVPPKSSKDGLSKYDKEGKGYYNDLIAGKGKEVISFEQHTQANMLTTTLEQNKFTGKYFNKQTNLFQVALEWEYMGKNCKSLLDIVDIDNELKTIRPVDLKTTGKSVFTFMRSYIDYKYYLQASFYTAALKFALKYDDRFIAYENYTVLPFQFIVIETNYKNPPHIFEVDEQDILVGEEGGKISGRDYSIKGFKELIEDLEYHRNNNQWEYKSEIYANDGIININSLKSREIEIAT